MSASALTDFPTLFGPQSSMTPLPLQRSNMSSTLAIPNPSHRFDFPFSRAKMTSPFCVSGAERESQTAISSSIVCGGMVSRRSCRVDKGVKSRFSVVLMPA